MISMDPKQLVYVLVIIPLILILAVTIFHGFAINARSPYESTVVNETVKGIADGGAWYTLDYSAKKNTTPSDLRVVDYTNNSYIGNFSINYGYAIDHSRIWIGDNEDGALNITYVAYKGSGYESFVKVYQQTTSGQKLGSMVPYVLIALTIVTVIIGAFGISKLV